MEHDTLAFINLYEVFGHMQEQAWNSLPQAGRRQVSQLNSRQVKAMMIVYLRSVRQEEALTLSRLAGFLNMKKAAASHMVSDLVGKKLLSRSVDPVNRRFIRISLAPKGRKTGGAIFAHATAQVSEILGRLPAGERAIFTSVATQIYDHYLCGTEGAE